MVIYRQRQRQTLADEDAPPTNSVNDIVNEVYDSSSRRSTVRIPLDPREARSLKFTPQTLSSDTPSRGSLFRPSLSQIPSTPKQQASPSAPSKPLFVVVFGYPPDKFSVTVEYFRSLGDATDLETNADISNCFRIGYANPAEAMRAVRKNGEVLGGSFMIGVKWAVSISSYISVLRFTTSHCRSSQDPSQAEALFGSPLARSSFGFSVNADSSPDVSMSDPSPPVRGFSSPESSLIISTAVQRTQTPQVGTPIRLAPSTSAFRKPGTGGGPSRLSQVTKPGDSTPGGLPLQPGGLAQASSSKGVLGQVSDLIFGW